MTITFNYDYKEDWVVAKQKVNNHQTAEILFIPYHEEGSKIINWWVEFTIVSKRKNKEKAMINIENTGNGGIEGLYFAFLAIQDFEKIYLPNFYARYENRIVVCWSDSLRKKIYQRSLQRIGYIMSRCPLKEEGNQMCLMKKVVI